MIYLIRHPQSLANVQRINSLLDGKITGRGKWQIKKTANKMIYENFEKIISSPALRCMDLAKEISYLCQIPLEINNQARERDYGVLTGKPGKDIFQLGIDGKPNGGESVIDVFNRAGSFYDNLNNKKNTVIVSHGLFLKMFSAHYLNLTIPSAVKILKFSNCGISKLNSGLIEYLNDRTHLGKEIKKIHIFGGWASGKTTLANKLGNLWNFPIYSLDHLKYENGLAKERSVEERINLLDKITSRDNWITEGAWTSYAISAFEKSDILIYQDTSLDTALYYAKKRNDSRRRIENVSHEKLIEEIVNYHNSNGKVSKIIHDQHFDKRSYCSIKSSNIDFNNLIFAEDLWNFVKK